MPKINYFKIDPIGKYYYFSIKNNNFKYDVTTSTLSRISRMPTLAYKQASPDLTHQERIDELLTLLVLTGQHTVNYNYDLYQ